MTNPPLCRPSEQFHPTGGWEFDTVPERGMVFVVALGVVQDRQSRDENHVYRRDETERRHRGGIQCHSQ